MKQRITLLSIIFFSLAGITSGWELTADSTLQIYGDILKKRFSDEVKLLDNYDLINNAQSLDTGQVESLAICDEREIYGVSMQFFPGEPFKHGSDEEIAEKERAVLAVERLERKTFWHAKKLVYAELKAKICALSNGGLNKESLKRLPEAPVNWLDIDYKSEIETHDFTWEVNQQDGANQKKTKIHGVFLVCKMSDVRISSKLEKTGIDTLSKALAWKISREALRYARENMGFTALLRRISELEGVERVIDRKLWHTTAVKLALMCRLKISNYKFTEGLRRRLEEFKKNRDNDLKKLTNEIVRQASEVDWEWQKTIDDLLSLEQTSRSVKRDSSSAVKVGE